MIYRHKPFEVNAVQYDGSPEANRAVISKSKTSPTRAFMDRTGPKISGDELLAQGILMLHQGEDMQAVHVGDYICEGQDGTLCAMPQDYFEATYEPLAPPEPVSSIIMPPKMVVN